MKHTLIQVSVVVLLHCLPFLVEGFVPPTSKNVTPTKKKTTTTSTTTRTTNVPFWMPVLSSSSTTSIPFLPPPIMLPPPPMIPGTPLRNFLKEKFNDYKENRRKMVSLLAMTLTDAITTQLDSSSTTAVGAATNYRLLNPENKQTNLSNEELAKIILQDGRERQFLFTADFSTSIYDDNATFKDGSDIDGSYPMNAWIRGCKLLFDPKQSQCKILEHTLKVSHQHVKFRFAETLTFNTVLRPRVYLTGSVVMKRDEQSGLIVSYEEKWDQDLNELLRRTKFAV